VIVLEKYVTDFIFFSDKHLYVATYSGSAIVRMNLDGSGETTIASAGFVAHALDIDNQMEYLYWGDRSPAALK
jgi:hypothetical protein